jgi:hypothetical protein
MIHWGAPPTRDESVDDSGAPTGHGIPARGATPGVGRGTDGVLKERGIGGLWPGAQLRRGFSDWAALGWPGPQEPGALPGRRGRKESNRPIRIDERIESLDFTHQNPKVSRNE